ncbi:hypothetical protein YS9_3363 [Enterococcus sp. C1]|uniref:hypothetical protein n=1 Tax=Enterococcus sp. C1 TaxID=1182762 RepID=UPI0002721948|nr:hypothetical protein [Enterococcus sp. C1]EJF48060.1 hypothetical protein YS9_3363 [Enterococcus sp. C1]
MLKKFVLTSMALLVLTFVADLVLPETIVSADTKKTAVHTITAVDNLVINGTFSDGMNGWDNTAPEKADIQNEDGTTFLRIKTGSGFGYITSQKVTNLVPNATYKLSVDSRKRNLGPIGIEALFVLLNSEGGMESKYPLVSSYFITQSVSLASSSKGELIILLVENPEMGDGYVDYTNIKLEKVDSTKSLDLVQKK